MDRVGIGTVFCLCSRSCKGTFMIRNYLLVAVRNIRQNLGYAAINIVGLAFGLASCVLISLYIMDEMSYDQFHTNGDRIYQLIRVKNLAGGNLSYHLGSSGAAGPALAQDFPEVEASLRYVSWDGTWTRYGEKSFNTRFCVTDPAFLDVFSFPLVRGNRATALKEHGSILIT
jgi:putative ABC transport system permease protein